MKKSMFRLVCLVLALAMVMASFVGCNKKPVDEDSDWEMGDFAIVGSDSESSEEQGDVDNNVESTDKDEDTPVTPVDPGKTTSLTANQVLKNMPEKLKNTTINFLYWEDKKNTDYKNAIASFEKKTGIKFKTTLATKNSYATELAGLIASGKSPDMFMCIYNSPDVVSNLQPIDVTGYNFNDTAWDKNLMNDFTFNGKTYAFQVDNSPQQNLCIIVYNKKALKKADMEDPYQIWKKNPSAWTWDKLWEMCDTFLAKNRNKEGYYGIGFGLEDAYLRAFDVGTFGYNPSTSKFENFISSNSAKKTETIKRFKILTEAFNTKRAQATWDKNSFDMGNTLFACVFSSSLEASHAYFSKLKGNVGSVPIPTDSVAVPGFEYVGYGIPVGAKNPGAVPYFVRYVFGRDIYNMDDFYIDEQAQEVVEYQIKQADKKVSYNTSWSWALWNSLQKSTAAQVDTIIDSYAPTVDAEIELRNKQIEKFHK